MTAVNGRYRPVLTVPFVCVGPRSPLTPKIICPALFRISTQTATPYSTAVEGVHIPLRACLIFSWPVLGSVD